MKRVFNLGLLSNPVMMAPKAPFLKAVMVTCSLALCCSSALAKTTGSVSQALEPNPTDTITNFMLQSQPSGGYTVVGADPESESVQSLLKTFEGLLAASNKHDLNDVMHYYSPQFISGDQFNLAQLKELIIETWKSYPDIRYTSAPKEIRINADWATIETMDESMATAPPDKEILENVPGRMNSKSRSLLFFKHVGDNWELTSDYTMWEEAIIRYGIGDEVPLALSTPDQIKAGQPYSAVVKTNVEVGTFIIGNIDNQPIKVPHPEPDQKFRAMEGGPTELQRVLVANSENLNEIVTATLGITNIEQKYRQERPSLSLNGIVTIVKRVNVIPISSEDMKKAMAKEETVKQSADGRVDVTKLTLQDKQDEEATETGSPSPTNAPASPTRSTPSNHSPFRK